MTLRTFILTLSSIFLTMPTFAFAGGSDGSGGKGVVCRAPDGSVQSVMTLDLWEASQLHQQNPLPVQDVKQAVDHLLVNLAQSFLYEGSYIDHGKKLCDGQACVLYSMRQVARRFLEPDPQVLRLKGIELEQTTDTLELARPSGCKIEQLVNFQESGAPISTGGTVLVNQDLVDRMDEINLASLIAHEAYYSVLRAMSKDKNSIRVRRAVGFVASGGRFVLPSKFETKSGQLNCANTDGSVQFAVAKNFNQIYFQKVDGNDLIGTSLMSRRANGVALQWVLFGNRTCSQTADGQRTPSLGTTALDGPVEYDRSIRFQALCRGGKVSKIFIQTRNPGFRDYTDTLVTCRRQR